MTKDVAKNHLDQLVDEFVKKVDFEKYNLSKRELEQVFNNWIAYGSIDLLHYNR